MDPVSALPAFGAEPAALEASADPVRQQLGQDTFLKLLVAQLRYQDPMNPADSQSFLAQTAQFTSVEKLEEIADAMATMSKNDELSTLGNLVGRTVQYRDEVGEVAEGTVTAGWADTDGLIIEVGDRQLHVDDILAVLAGTSVA